MINKVKSISNAVTRVQKIIAFALLLAVLCTVTAFATVSAGCYVEISDGEEVTKIFAINPTPEEALEKAGISINGLDKLDLSGYVEGENSSIDVLRSYLVGVDDGESTVFIESTGTVADAIEKAALTVGEDDVLNYPLETRLAEDMVIKISRAFPVSVYFHGEKKSVSLAIGTVADALKAAGVTVGENDVVSRSVGEILTDGMKIYVDEVIIKTVKETEDIDYDTLKVKDSSLYVGKTKVSVKGVKGEKEVEYEEKYVNGALKSKKLLSSEVIKEPTDEKILVGSKKYTVKAKGGAYSTMAMPSDIKLDSNGIPTQYKKVLTGKAVAYTGGTTTSTGKAVCVGCVAVDPDVIPYGSKLYIVANDGTVYGYGIAADTGSGVCRGAALVDLYMTSTSDCYAWGARQASVYVL